MNLEDVMSRTGGIGEKIGQLDVPDEEKMQLGLRLARGYMFLHILAHGDGYEYASKGVRLGDADIAIF